MSYNKYIVYSDIELSRPLNRREYILFNSNVLKDTTYQDFRAFEEIKFNPQYENFEFIDGQTLCPTTYYPKDTFWFYDVVENLIYHEDNVVDMFPISTFEFMIRTILKPLNIKVSGEMAFYSEGSYEGCFYIIENNSIKYHKNKTLEWIEDIQETCSEHLESYR